MVVGFRNLDSGKTTLTRALLHYFDEEGLKVCGFKPKAANNLWRDYDIIYESLSKGKIYGKDAKLLKSDSKTDLPEEVINPIHRLWIEDPDSNRFNELPRFIVDRVKSPLKNNDSFLVLNKPVLGKYPEYSELIKKLSYHDIIEITNIMELNEVINKYYADAIDSAYNIIKEKNEILVTESYGDTALPWNKLENVKAVLGIEPWSIYLYDPKEYFSAVYLNIQLKNNFEISTNVIKGLIKPIKKIRIRPSTSTNVIDYLKNKIDTIFEVVRLNNKK